MNRELSIGQLWHENIGQLMIIGVIVAKNHDVSYNDCLWEIADFVYKGEECVGSSLRELMEHEIKRREFGGSINPNIGRIIPFPKNI